MKRLNQGHRLTTKTGPAFNKLWHEQSVTLVVAAGKLASPDVNCQDSVILGTEMMHNFKSGWLFSFYIKISKDAHTMQTQKKHVAFGD